MSATNGENCTGCCIACPHEEYKTAKGRANCPTYKERVRATRRITYALRKKRGELAK